MKSIVLQSDFTVGTLSDRFLGAVDKPFYSRGASILNNMRPLPQGGVESTGGYKVLKSLRPEGTRLIPFIISESLSFLLVISESAISYFEVAVDGSLSEEFTLDGVSLSYTKKTLFEIQYCQNYNKLFFTHRTHSPRVFTYSGGELIYSDLSTTTNAEKNPIHFSDPADHPGCCAFFNGRLFLAGSTAKPQGIWASKSYESNNFTWFEEVQTTVATFKPKNEWDDPEVPEPDEKTVVREVIGDDNAFSFEIASDQNDQIVFLAAGKSLIVGTITSEWIISDDIHANNIRARLTTRYGSTRTQTKLISDNLILLQRGKKRLYEYKGSGSKELTYLCPEVLESRVVEIEGTRNPDQEIFCVLENGDIAVLQYDISISLSSWYKLSSLSNYESIASVSTESQDYLFAVVEKDSLRSLILFDKSMKQGEDSLLSQFISMPIETQIQNGSTLGQKKKIGEAVVSLLEGSIEVGYKNGSKRLLTSSREVQKVPIRGSFLNCVQVEIIAKGDNPMRLSSIAYEVEANNL